MRAIHRLAAAALAASALQAEAFVEHHEGTLASRDQVALLDLNLGADVPQLYLWTDSYQSGARIDPMVGLWSAAGDDWSRVAFNDDGRITDGQTSYDSGQLVVDVGAGAYRLSVSVYPNVPNGSLLSEGFRNDNPSPLSPDFGYYSLYVSDVAPPPPSSSSPIPEPATWALMLGGLAIVSRVARRRPPEA